MKKIGLFLFVLFSITAHAQKLDDLLKKASKETNKDSLFFLYDKISIAYTNVNVDKAIEFQKKSLELGKLKNTGVNLAYSYSSLGNLYMYKGNLNEAIANLTEGLRILEKSNELSRAGLTYGNIGNVYLKLKMYDKALEFFNKGLDIKKKLKEKKIHFKPSAVAINPKTNELYILSSVNKLLVITDRRGRVKEVYPLNPVIYKQPEGMAFTPWGDLLISNEAGESGNANILILKPKK